MEIELVPLPLLSYFPPFPPFAPLPPSAMNNKQMRELGLTWSSDSESEGSDEEDERPTHPEDIHCTKEERGKFEKAAARLLTSNPRKRVKNMTKKEEAKTLVFILKDMENKARIARKKKVVREEESLHEERDLQQAKKRLEYSISTSGRPSRIQNFSQINKGTKKVHPTHVDQAELTTATIDPELVVKDQLWRSSCSALSLVVEMASLEDADDRRLPKTSTDAEFPLYPLVVWDAHPREWCEFKQELCDVHQKYIVSAVDGTKRLNPCYFIKPQTSNDYLEAHELLLRVLYLRCYQTLSEEEKAANPVSMATLLMRTLPDLQDPELVKELLNSAPSLLAQHTHTPLNSDGGEGAPEAQSCIQMHQNGTRCNYLRFPANALYVDHMLSQSMVSSGKVIVCLDTGAVHRCYRDVCCTHAELNADRDAWVCLVTGHTSGNVFHSLAPKLKSEKARAVIDESGCMAESLYDQEMSDGDLDDAHEQILMVAAGGPSYQGQTRIMPVGDDMPVSTPQLSGVAASLTAKRDFAKPRVKKFEDKSWRMDIDARGQSAEITDKAIVSRSLSFIAPTQDVMHIISGESNVCVPNSSTEPVITSNIGEAISSSLGVLKKKRMSKVHRKTPSTNTSPTAMTAHDISTTKAKKDESIQCVAMRPTTQTHRTRMNGTISATVDQMISQVCISALDYGPMCVSEARTRLSAIKSKLKKHLAEAQCPALWSIASEITAEEPRFEELVKLAYMPQTKMFYVAEHEERMGLLRDSLVRTLQFIMHADITKENMHYIPGFGFQDIRPLTGYLLRIMDGLDSLPPDLMPLALLRTSSHSISLVKPELRAMSIDKFVDTGRTGKPVKLAKVVSKLNVMMSCYIHKQVLCT